MTNRKSRLLDKLMGSPVLKNAQMLQLFMCMYFKISDTEHTIKTMAGPVTVRPGSVLISVTKFSTALSISRPTIDRYLATFRELGLLVFGEMGRAGTLVTFNLSTECGDVARDGGDPVCIGTVRTVSDGKCVVPTVAVDVKPDSVRTDNAYAPTIIVSSLTSYEVRKDKKAHAHEGRHETQVAGKAACEGGNKVTQGQGPLLCTASPTQPSVQGAPVSSGVVPVTSPTLSPSPASPKLGVAQRLKLDRQQERDREAQRTAGTVVSEGRDRACAAMPQPTVMLSCPPSSSAPPKVSLKAADIPTRFDDDSAPVRLAQQLIDLILSEMPDAACCRSATGRSWARGMHIMLVEDGRNPDEVSAILDYVAVHDRWNIASIMGPAKLKAQYDRLAVKYRTRKGAVKSRTQSDKATPQAVVTQREDSMARLARLQTEHAEKCGGVIAPNLGAEFGF